MLLPTIPDRTKLVPWLTSVHDPPGVHVVEGTAQLNKVPPYCTLGDQLFLFLEMLKREGVIVCVCVCVGGGTPLSFWRGPQHLLAPIQCLTVCVCVCVCVWGGVDVRVCGRVCVCTTQYVSLSTKPVQWHV